MRWHRWAATIAAAVGLAATGLSPMLNPAGAAQTTPNELVDPGSCMVTPPQNAAVSNDGGWAAFVGDTCVSGSGTHQGYVRSLETGLYEQVSLRSDNSELTGLGTTLSISDDGRFVAMIADRGNQNGSQVYVRDRVAQSLSVEVVNEHGNLGANGANGAPLLSADGTYVAFTTTDPLLDDDTNGLPDIYVRNRSTGGLDRVDAGTDPNNMPVLEGLSGDGRHVLFSTSAALNASDTNGMTDVYVADLDLGSNEFLAADSGAPAGSSVTQHLNAMSADAGRVLYAANANGDWIVYDRVASTRTVVNRDAAGNRLSQPGVLDQTGTYVAFTSANLFPESGDQKYHLSDGSDVGSCAAKNGPFVRNVDTGTVTFALKDGHGDVPENSGFCDLLSWPTAISSDGQFVFLQSNRSDLIAAYTPTPGTHLYRAWTGYVAPPTNLVAPSLTGTIAVGSDVFCDVGTWSGDAQYDIIWVVDNAIVPDETADSYTVRLADAGKSLSCSVTATNSGGSNTANAPDQQVPPVSAPVNVVAPKISGTVAVGSTLTCNPGTWNGSPTPQYYFDWLKNNVLQPAAADSSTYTLASSDAGSNITCQVTANNVAGTTGPVNSKAVSLPAPPTVTRAPNVTASQAPARPGTILTCNRGGWTGAPTSYAFQWARNTGAGPVVLGAFSTSASTYVVSSADIGASLTCAVVATNAGGSSAPAAASNAIVVPAVPSNTVAPTVSTSGPLRVGVAITCNKGTWTPTSPTPTYSYQWTRNGTVFGSPSTTTKYATTTADKGKVIRCQVRATNTSGTSNWVTSSNSVSIA